MKWMTESNQLFLLEVLDKNGLQEGVPGGVVIPFNQVCVSVRLFICLSDCADFLDATPLKGIVGS